MENKLEVGQIVEQIKGAFRPLVCKAESWDYRDKIRLKVLHEGEIFYEMKSLQTDDYASPDKLANFLNDVRQVVREKMRVTVPSFEFDDPDPVGD